jgi:hypothetical protein
VRELAARAPWFEKVEREEFRTQMTCLQPGDRVRFTALGRDRNPKLSHRTGLVVAVGGKATSRRIISVKLDGNVMPTRFHWSYIELVDGRHRSVREEAAEPDLRVPSL